MAIAVFPDDDSMITVSGWMSPRSSACSIMCSAGRALTDHPGLADSSLTKISGGGSGRSAKTGIRRTSPPTESTGVEPSIPSIESNGLQFPPRSLEGLMHGLWANLASPFIAVRRAPEGRGPEWREARALLCDGRSSVRRSGAMRPSKRSHSTPAALCVRPALTTSCKSYLRFLRFIAPITNHRCRLLIAVHFRFRNRVK